MPRSFLRFVLLAFFALGDANAEPLRVGLAVPLSGRAAWLGENTKRGFELFEAEEPEKAQRLKLVYEDVTTDSLTRGVAAVRKLINEDRVDAMVLEVSGIANAAAPFIEREGIPTFAITGADVAEGKKWIIKHWLHSSREAEAIFEALNKDGVRRIALLTTEQDSMLARSKSLRALVNAQNPKVLELIADEQITNSPEIDSIVPRIATSGVDAIVFNLMPGECAQLAKRLRTLKWQGTLYSSAIAAEKTEIEAADGALRGTKYPYAKLSDTFLEAYRKRYGTDPEVGVAEGYAAAQILSAAADAVSPGLTGAGKRAALNRALRAPVKGGAYGDYDFREDLGNNFDIPVELKVVE